jgi:zinc/manganese transport system substrate-binding protein/manganese/iron transport system substrate-binding protein
VLLAAAAALGGCAPSTSTPPDPSAPIRVVTTSTVLGDLIRQTGGDRVAVTSLVPPGVDVHTYQATPADLQALAEADLVVMNGLGLDDWLGDMIETVSGGPQSRVPIVRLAEDSLDFELLPGEEPDTRNPHLWMDVNYAIEYVDRIEIALVAIAPAKAADIGRSSDAYRAAITELDGWVREQISTIPVENRKIVTFHDALPYFARAYGLTIVGVAVEAPGQDPSAGEIAALIDAIRASGVKAIFSEDQFPTALIDQIAGETGATVVADLYDDSLGDPPVTSYEAVIRWDVEKLVEALR